MQPIPEDILTQFNVVLAQKEVSSSLQDEYRKWLKYYLDFLVKYPPPDRKLPARWIFNGFGYPATVMALIKKEDGRLPSSYQINLK